MTFAKISDYIFCHTSAVFLIRWCLLYISCEARWWRHSYIDNCDYVFVRLKRMRLKSTRIILTLLQKKLNYVTWRLIERFWWIRGTRILNFHPQTSELTKKFRNDAKPSTVSRATHLEGTSRTLPHKWGRNKITWTHSACEQDKTRESRWTVKFDDNLTWSSYRTFSQSWLYRISVLWQRNGSVTDQTLSDDFLRYTDVKFSQQKQCHNAERTTRTRRKLFDSRLTVVNVLKWREMLLCQRLTTVLTSRSVDVRMVDVINGCQTNYRLTIERTAWSTASKRSVPVYICILSVGCRRV